MHSSSILAQRGLITAMGDDQVLTTKDTHL